MLYKTYDIVYSFQTLYISIVYMKTQINLFLHLYIKDIWIFHQILEANFFNTSKTKKAQNYSTPPSSFPQKSRTQD
jgi:hypothetical protein